VVYTRLSMDSSQLYKIFTNIFTFILSAGTVITTTTNMPKAEIELKQVRKHNKNIQIH